MDKYTIEEASRMIESGCAPDGVIYIAPPGCWFDDNAGPLAQTAAERGMGLAEYQRLAMTEAGFTPEAIRLFMATWEDGDPMTWQQAVSDVRKTHNCSLCGEPTEFEGGTMAAWYLCTRCEGTPAAEAAGYTHTEAGQ